MLVGDLIYNNEFDCNCNYIVYDCSNGEQWGDDDAKILYSSITDGSHKPLDAVLDMKIKYITTSNNVIIIEATR